MARDIRVAILGDSRDFSRAVGVAQRDARKLDGAFSNIGRSAARMGKVVAIGVGALAVGGAALAKSFIQAAEDGQKVTRQTEAVIKSMGGAANVTAKQVIDLSESLARATGVDDELIQSGQNVLMTFGLIRNELGKGNKVFDRATHAALDMSVALGQDMQSATVMVGKALNDPLRGLTALNKAGIQFTDQQKDQIKWLVENNRTLGAQKIILAELERQFGGSAMAQSTASARLRATWEILKGEMGDRLLPVFNAVADWLAKSLPVILDTASRAFSRFAEFISPAVDAVKGFVSDALEDLSGWWSRNGEGIKTWIGDVGTALGTAVSSGFGALSNWWSNNGDNIANWFAGVGRILKDEVAPALAAVGRFIKDEVQPALAGLGSWITDNEYVFTTLKVAVGLLAGAYVALAVAAGAAAIAQGAALLPFIAAAIVVAALWVGFQKFEEKYQLVTKALIRSRVAWQWMIDKLAQVVELAKDAVHWLGKIEMPKLPGGIGIPLPGNIGGGVPFVPFLDNGGIMPGPRGVHRPAMVAGGETVIPTHKPGVSAGGLNIGEIHIHNPVPEPASVTLPREMRSILWQLGVAS